MTEPGVTYWRDVLTDSVYRTEVFEDATVIDPRPVASSLDATEMEYHMGMGAGEDAIAGWLQTGIDVATAEEAFITEV